MGAQSVLLRTFLLCSVVHSKALVIHCRERAHDESHIGKDCHCILRKILPMYYFIHLYCFIGDLDEAKYWVDLFPKCCFG